LSACFVVKDSNGQKVAFVCLEDDPGRRSAAKLLTHDEAQRIAENIAKLPIERAVVVAAILLWAMSGISSKEPQ